MNFYLQSRRQASSTVAFLAYGKVCRGGVLPDMRFPARKHSG